MMGQSGVGILYRKGAGAEIRQIKGACKMLAHVRGW